MPETSQRKAGLGADPLAGILGPKPATAEPEASAPEPIRPRLAVKPTARIRSVRSTYHLPADLVESVRDASYWARIPASRIVTQAIERELKRLAREHNNGEAFQRRPA